MNNAKNLGKLSEELAAHYLRSLGFCIVAANIFSRFGEIDIIAFKHASYYLIEVKSQKLNSNYNGYNLTASKFRKIIKTFRLTYPWIKQTPQISYVFIVWSSDSKYAINQEYHTTCYEDWH